MKTSAPTFDVGNTRRVSHASSFLKPGRAPPACKAGLVVEFRVDEGGVWAAEGAEAVSWSPPYPDASKIDW